MLGASLKAGIGRLIVDSEPLLLPFYHHGMRELLPVGARMPRPRKAVRMVFGQPADGQSVVREVRRRSGSELSGPALWDAVTQRTYELLKGLESEVRPSIVLRDVAA